MGIQYIMAGQKIKMKGLDLNQDGVVDEVEELDRYHETGLATINTPTETGDAMQSLDR